MLDTFVTQMHKKAFGDWAYSAPPYIARLKSGREAQERGGREETKGWGGKRQDTSSPPTNNAWNRHCTQGQAERTNSYDRYEILGLHTTMCM